MPPQGTIDRMIDRQRDLRAAEANQPTWDLNYHTYFRINVENQTTSVAFLGPESEEYGAPGWIKASAQNGTTATDALAARLEASQALRAAIAQKKIQAHSSAADVEVFPFVTQSEGNKELRAQYDREKGAGSASALFEKATATGRGTTHNEQNVILSTLLGAPYAKALRIQFDSRRGPGSADNLFAKLGVAVPAMKAAAAPVPTIPVQQPSHSSTATQPKSGARPRLANYFDTQLAAKSAAMVSRTQPQSSSSRAKSRAIAKTIAAQSEPDNGKSRAITNVVAAQSSGGPRPLATLAPKNQPPLAAIPALWESPPA